jgi:hypothetical protein
LKVIGSLDQLEGICIELYFLASIVVRDDQFVRGAIGLMTDLIVQTGLLTLEEPNHASGISVPNAGAL